MAVRSSDGGVADLGRSDRVPALATAARARPAGRAWPGPEALLGGRVRGRELTGVELGAGVAWRSWFARATYQPGARWDLDGRPVDVSGVALAAGYRPAVLARGAWRVGPSVAVGVERVALRRADLQDAADHAYWDPGIAAGGAITRDLAGVLRVTLQLEACRSFGRTVRIPGGPEASFNRLGARAALSLAWLP